MRNVGLAIIGLVASMQVVHAQPGQTPPSPSGPPAPPGPYVPPPDAYGQPPYAHSALVTPEEEALLLRGEISDGQLLGGAAVNLFVGFGLGQAIQGRWGDTGWIFTLGEAASLTVAFGALIEGLDCGYDEDCHGDFNGGLFIGGFLAYAVFRVWSIGDAIAGPPAHNQRLRQIKMRLGIPLRQVALQPYLNRTPEGGGTAGLSLRF